MDDAGVVSIGVIDSRPTAEAENVVTEPAEQPAARPEAAEAQSEERATVPPVPAAEPVPRQAPTVRARRDYADEFGRFAIKVGSALATIGSALIAFGAAIGKAVVRIATLGWHIVAEIPPALRLLGALGLSALVSIVGSVTLDSALGTTFAVVLVPCFSLALGVVAHKWYAGLRQDHGTDTDSAPRSTGEIERSVEFVDTKLAYALNSLGTERHQQAVIALIQAKTATELYMATAKEPIQPARPRIRDGGASKALQHKDVPSPGRS